MSAEEEAVAVTSTSSALPIRLVQKVLHASHENLGLEWWATIAVCTVGFRMALVPLVVAQLRTARRMFSGAAPAQFAHITNLASRDLKNTKQGVQGKALILSLYLRGVSGILRRNNVSLSKVFAVPLIQIPMFLTYVLATRDLITHDLARQWGMDKGGILWFTDLTSVDSTFVLPVTAVGLTYLTIEQGWGFSPTIRHVLQTAVLMSSPFVLSQLPAGVFMYWIPSSLFGLAQSATIRKFSAPPKPVIATSTATASGKKTITPLIDPNSNPTKLPLSNSTNTKPTGD